MINILFCSHKMKVLIHFYFKQLTVVYKLVLILHARDHHMKKKNENIIL